MENINRNAQHLLDLRRSYESLKLGAKQKIPTNQAFSAFFKSKKPESINLLSLEAANEVAVQETILNSPKQDQRQRNANSKSQANINTLPQSSWLSPRQLDSVFMTQTNKDCDF